MRRALLPVLLAFAAVSFARVGDDFDSPEWKDEIASGYLPYRKLTYDDFPAAHGIPTSHKMWTQGFVHYSYRARWTQQGSTFTAKISQISIRSGFDQNKSWKRDSISESKALIAHEQGHLDINEIHAEELRQATLPEGESSSGQGALDDLKSKLVDVFDRMNKEAQSEQDEYDQATSHGGLEDEQDAWNKKLRKRLDELHVKYWNQK